MNILRMNKMKSTYRTIVICSLLSMPFWGNAQDYYGGGGGWRRRQANSSQPKKEDKEPLNPNPSGYMSVNFGFAIPEGSFAQTFSQGSYSEAVGTGYGNYAQPGTIFHFSLGIPIQHSNFGIALMFGSAVNPYNLDSYVNSLNNSSVNYNPYSNSIITGYGTAPSQNQYSENSIMGGPFYTYPIGRLSIDARFMIGALLSSLPEQNVYAEDADGDALEFDVEPSNSTSFAFDAGIGVRFLIAQFGRRKLCAMVNVDYLYSNVSYSTQQDLSVIPATGPNAGYQGTLYPSPSVTGSFPVELLNITFGIGYQIGGGK